MNILAFAASSSKNSINSKLIHYAASLMKDTTVTVLDINDYKMPLFSVDREAALGQPQQAQDFYAAIGSADGLIISFAEHNGSYTAAYKNLFDWTSRIDMKVFQGKPAVYFSASPGPGGGKNVLASAAASAPHFGANLIADVSVPKFHTVYDAATNSLMDGPERDAVMAAAQNLQRVLAS